MARKKSNMKRVNMDLYMLKSRHKNKKKRVVKKKTATPRRKAAGLKANGQLKKGFRYTKGGRLVASRRKK